MKKGGGSVELFLILLCSGAFLVCVGLSGLFWSALRLKQGRWEIPHQEIIEWLHTPGNWGGRRWIIWIVVGFLMLMYCLYVMFAAF